MSPQISEANGSAMDLDGQPRPVLLMDMPAPKKGAAGAALAQQLQRWAGNAQWQLLSSFKGRVVQQVGNGLLMEFADARGCLQAGFALAAGELAGLRAAAHLAGHAQDAGASAGHDQKLVSDLVQQARPGEMLVTAELRDRLADGLDADFEDLGYRRIQPQGDAIRLFRAHSGQEDGLEAGRTKDLRPGLAIMPFKGASLDLREQMIGELVAEGVIRRLSHSIGIRVISRQSTSAMRDFGALSEVGRRLGASFVLSGSYTVKGRGLVVQAELAEAQRRTLLWSGQFQHTVDDLLQEDSQLLYALAHAVAQALDKAHVHRGLVRPLPSLDSSYLMLAGMSMTHSHSGRTFERGRAVLGELVGRHPRYALPRAWLGLWHALNVVKGQSADPARDTQLAREQTLRALDAEPGSAMALAVEGYIQCQLMGDPRKAHHFLNEAIEANPSEPMAWLFKSLASCMWGSSTASVSEALIARALSPVDPLRYFFDLLTANALLADHQHEQAIAYARRSLRANADHVPTLRLLLIAQSENKQLRDARKTLALMLAQTPNLTVSSYLAMGSPDSPLRQRAARALRRAGLPES